MMRRLRFGLLCLLLLAQVTIGQRRLARLSAIEWTGLLFIVGMLLSVPASRLGIVGGVQNVFDTVALPLFCFFFARNLLAGEQGLGRLAVVLALVGAVPRWSMHTQAVVGVAATVSESVRIAGLPSTTAGRWRHRVVLGDPLRHGRRGR